MANEIQLSIRLNCRNGTTFEHLWQPSTFNITQSTAYGSGGGQILNGTTPETLTITDVAAAGVFYARNLSGSATIQIGRASGTSFTSLVSLLPGEPMIGRLSVTNPSAIVTTTNTAALQFFMLDA